MMPHWTSLHIARFRRLRELKLHDLGAINLLVGKNNSGKTSVLESISVLCHPRSAFTWIDTARERELKASRTPILETLGWLFPHAAPRANGFEGTAMLAGVLQQTGGSWQTKASYREFRQTPVAGSFSPETTDEDEAAGDDSEYAALLDVTATKLTREQVIESEFHESFQFSGKSYRAAVTESAPFLPCQLITPVSHRTNQSLLMTLTQIIREERKPEIISLLKLLAADVEDVEILAPEGRRAVVNVKHHGIGFVPLAVEGDGMRRALAFSAATTLARNGVLLIDEVETALHPEALTEVFGFLVNVCRAAQVQLFVTTHSLEAVDAMLASVGDAVSDLVAYHLPPRDSGQAVLRLGGKSIRDLRQVGGLDLR